MPCFPPPSLNATTPIGDCILQPSSGLWPPRLRGFLITHNDAPQSVGLLWTSDQSGAETSTWQHTTLNNRQTSMPRVGFEPTISAGEWPKTYALDRAATGTDMSWFTQSKASARSQKIPTSCTLFNYTDFSQHNKQITTIIFIVTATCFDSRESSSG